MTTSLDTRSKDTIVGTIAAGMQSRLPSVLLNFAKGKVFRALAEAYAGATLWLQKELVTVLALTRASTSDNDDLDSWMADYGLARLPANASSGLVTFARYTASAAAPVIPVGTLVQTGDGSLRFAVYPDLQNSAYSAAAGGYVLPAGVSAVSIPVQAVTPGTIGNVAAGSISLLASAVPGIDLVANPSAFSNGINSESDAALRARFVLFINSLAQATIPAIAYAIQSLQAGLNYTITETANLDGRRTPGFSVVVDDGSGSPPVALITAATAAVNKVRAAGVQFTLSGPSVIGASVGLHVVALPGYDQNLVEAAVSNTIAPFISGLGLGNALNYFDIAAVAKGVPGVGKIVGLTLNGGTADIVATPAQTIKSTGVTLF